jgi:hypothetical protein
MRKQIITSPSVKAVVSSAGGLDLNTIATVLVTSELAGHPVENAFDGRGDSGGTRWISETGGEQAVMLAFDAPQTIRSVSLEIEETETSRTQELQLAISCDGEKTWRELVHQEFNFSPTGSTFEREEWTINAEGVTHLRLQVKPDKSGQPCRASLTSLVLR